MKLALTYYEVKALKPCSHTWDRVYNLLGGDTGYIDAATARDAGCSLDDLIWVASYLSRTDADIERRLFLWIADCLAHAATRDAAAAAACAAAAEESWQLDRLVEWLSENEPEDWPITTGEFADD